MITCCDEGWGSGSVGRSFFQLGYFSAESTDGLPTTVITSAYDGTTQFQLQPFNNTNNVVFLPYGDTTHPTTLTLTTPAAYSQLALFASSIGPADTSLGYTITYSDLSTTTGTWDVPNWFTGGASIAINEHGRSIYHGTRGRTPLRAAGAFTSKMLPSIRPR